MLKPMNNGQTTYQLAGFLPSTVEKLRKFEIHGFSKNDQELMLNSIVIGRLLVCEFMLPGSMAIDDHPSSSMILPLTLPFTIWACSMEDRTPKNSDPAQSAQPGAVHPFERTGFHAGSSQVMW